MTALSSRRPGAEEERRHEKAFRMAKIAREVGATAADLPELSEAGWQLLTDATNRAYGLPNDAEKAHRAPSETTRAMIAANLQRWEQEA